ncbi:low temperature requirement protein A, partial [Micromonospora sp. GCM10011541]
YGRYARVIPTRPPNLAEITSMINLDYRRSMSRPPGRVAVPVQPPGRLGSTPLSVGQDGCWAKVEGGRRPDYLHDLDRLTISKNKLVNNDNDGAGALVHDRLLRGGLWALALAIEFPGFVVGFSQWAGRQVAGEHLAERLQQIFLISLGEAVFVSGRAFSDSDLALPHGMGFGLAFIGIVQLWRIYFYRAGLVLALAIGAARNPARQSVAAALNHMIMISGVVLAGAGFELYIIDPTGRPEPNWLVAILGGPALFLLGRAPFELQVFGRISLSRLIGLLALGLLIPAVWHAPPLVAGAGATAVLGGIVVADARRARGREPEPPAPLM